MSLMGGGSGAGARLSRLLGRGRRHGGSDAGGANQAAAGLPLSRVKDRRHLVELLMAVERQYPVNAIAIHDLHLWPLVRLEVGKSFKLADQLTDAGIGAGGAEQENAAPGGYPATATERKALIRARKQALPRTPEAAQRLVDGQWARLALAGRADFLVLTKIEKYYQRIGERRYAPVLDPVYEDLARRGRALAVGLEPLDFACVNEPLRLDLAPHMIATSGWPAVDDPQARRRLEEVDRLVQALDPGFAASPDAIIGRYNRLRRRAAFFRRIFEIVRPRAIFLSAFTGWLPAVWAARRLGIPTVDVQHGGQHAVHHATTHYGNVPRDGYALLPDFFWSWGELNRGTIAKWLPGGAVRHIPIVGGHRNVAKWYRERDAGTLAAADRDFLERFSGRDGLVLVTLSYAVDRLMPDSLLEAIAATPDLTWLIRLHPNHRNRESRAQIGDALTSRGCRSFHIGAPTDVRLQTALAVAGHHLTPFSTSGREATAFGLSTTICHPIGAKMFQEEIAGGDYVFAEEAQAIVASVRDGLARRPADEAARRHIVEIADEAVDRLLATVLAGPPGQRT